MTMFRFASLGLMAAALAVPHSARAYECWAEETADVILEKADQVFRGTLKSKEGFGRNYDELGTDRKKLIFTLRASWKGLPEDAREATVDVESFYKYDFKEGEEYLIYAYHIYPGRYSLVGCPRSLSMDVAEKSIHRLGDPTIWHSGEPESYFEGGRPPGVEKPGDNAVEEDDTAYVSPDEPDIDQEEEGRAVEEATDDGDIEALFGEEIEETAESAPSEEAPEVEQVPLNMPEEVEKDKATPEVLAPLDNTKKVAQEAPAVEATEAPKPRKVERGVSSNVDDVADSLTEVLDAPQAEMVEEEAPALMLPDIGEGETRPETTPGAVEELDIDKALENLDKALEEL